MTNIISPDTQDKLFSYIYMILSENGIRNEDSLITELKARLSVQRVATFDEIVTKVTNDIDIDKYKENK